VIRVRKGSRDDLRRHLAENGIDTGVYYPLPLHLQECFGDLGGRIGDLPVAEEASRTCVALPIHPDLTSEEVEFVAKQVVHWANAQG
jgi:dTDP-4-amino-4,6-dideoxygalactose transaminase